MTSTHHDLTQRLIRFRDERDWGPYHSLKNLMVSLTLEASELLELSQWKSDEDLEQALTDTAFQHRLGEECADVFLYLLMICERAGLDLETVARDKIELNESKYPVHKARGNARKYNDFSD
ncbi:nucleotide pyrophosphohydrolase [Magnetospira sp. QH-2]|uniref:nucleotide pyrophosphohydrolase n=1 Tax=Magnetospira sp. (strain QH-2) TaxID=1288970 RepID=UPI0003E80AAA|nr:nucleotide pyrophosphohydrolase [Magnetospira sp. QH-2]CCQ73113.1 protein of unknown function [Magnetospira sp. QH-2]